MGNSQGPNTSGKEKHRHVLVRVSSRKIRAQKNGGGVGKKKETKINEKIIPKKSLRH